jgi:hypothetical protein
VKTSPHPQQLLMPEELEAWALKDFSDLSLPRKALTDESIETFRRRSGPLSLDQHLSESLFDLI